MEISRCENKPLGLYIARYQYFHVTLSISKHIKDKYKVIWASHFKRFCAEWFHKKGGPYAMHTVRVRKIQISPHLKTSWWFGQILL